MSKFFAKILIKFSIKFVKFFKIANNFLKVFLKFS